MVVSEWFSYCLQYGDDEFPLTKSVSIVLEQLGRNDQRQDRKERKEETERNGGELWIGRNDYLITTHRAQSAFVRYENGEEEGGEYDGDGEEEEAEALALGEMSSDSELDTDDEDLKWKGLSDSVGNFRCFWGGSG